MLEECTEKIKQMHQAANNSDVDVKYSITANDSNSAALNSDNNNANISDNGIIYNNDRDAGHAGNKHAKNLRRSTDAMQIDNAEDKVQQEQLKKNDEEAQEYYKHLRSLRLSVIKK